MKRLLATAALAAALASPAAAQVAGTYAGTSADGQSVTVFVGTDPITTNLAIVGAEIFYNAPCKGKSGTVLTSGIGYNPNTDLNGNTVTVDFDISNIASHFVLTFNNDTNTATGTIATYAPDLYPVGATVPKKALFCVSKKQALNLTLTGMSKVPPMRAGTYTSLNTHR
jgi:opacity protein-like surface antigen